MKKAPSESSTSATELKLPGDLFDIKPVGPNTISAISIMGEKEKLAGNVLRRLCKLGGEACAQTCALHQGIIERVEASIDSKCADENLNQVITELGAKPENLLMIGVTADNIGFADEIDSDPEKYKYSVSPATGIKEMPGFNAFFAREGDVVAGHEVNVLGRRLADCGDINLEFRDAEGKKVMGFMHMTKPNLQGEGAQKYEFQGKKVGSFEYFLRTAMEHYGADISTVQVRVAAAIKQEHYKYTFDDDAKLDQHFPGWKELGLVSNKSNPDWQPGQPTAGDTLNMDFSGMLRWQMAQVAELKLEQISWEGAIDPGDTGSQHASNHRGYFDKTQDGRDAYFTAWIDKLKP